MTELGLGVATLEHEQTGRTDPDAVDATLAASGDASAFERLYRTHVPKVYGLVRRMLNDDDVDEVAQDVFVRAWQKLGTFRGEAAFGTWLHRLAVNVILARRETLGTRRKRYLEGDAALETIPTRRPGPELSMDFEAAMQRLPDGAREVFARCRRLPARGDRPDAGAGNRHFKVAAAPRTDGVAPAPGALRRRHDTRSLDRPPFGIHRR
jgi:RNA polymerase sigma-70 factor (ECF subfamily)